MPLSWQVIISDYPLKILQESARCIFLWVDKCHFHSLAVELLYIGYGRTLASQKVSQNNMTPVKSHPLNQILTHNPTFLVQNYRMTHGLAMAFRHLKRNPWYDYQSFNCKSGSQNRDSNGNINAISVKPNGVLGCMISDSLLFTINVIRDWNPDS